MHTLPIQKIESEIGVSRFALCSYYVFGTLLVGVHNPPISHIFTQFLISKFSYEICSNSSNETRAFAHNSFSKCFYAKDSKFTDNIHQRDDFDCYNW